MAGYIPLIVGMLLLTTMSTFMSSAIKKGDLEKNNAIGFRTKATLSSENAWEAGHQKSVPYLQATTIIGTLGVITSIVALFLFNRGSDVFNSGLFVVPIFSFVIQVLMILYAAIKANSAAQRV